MLIETGLLIEPIEQINIALLLHATSWPFLFYSTCCKCQLAEAKAVLADYDLGMKDASLNHLDTSSICRIYQVPCFSDLSATFTFPKVFLGCVFLKTLANIGFL